MHQSTCLLTVTLLYLLHHGRAQFGQLGPGILENLDKILGDLIQQSEEEPRSKVNIENEYDFIIVGAGTAGSTLANRLTEVPEWKVLLIEAGGEENFVMDIPIVANFLQFTTANWKYKTVPSNTSCLGHQNKQCNFPRGKVMGGCSVLNYMIYTRGHPKDYDNWAALGNKGWSYQDVLPYFMKSEDMSIPELARDTKYHSTGGYLTISYAPYHTPLADAFLQAGLETGQKLVDYNAQSMTGFSYLQNTMKNGTRWSSSRAFLHPIRKRKNLHVKKMSMVIKIIIDPQTKVAEGVQFVHNRRYYTVRARKEVIVSAGAINSPQLLMLSGIGPREHLESVGIPVIQDLPVGYNLMDHIASGGVVFTIDKNMSLITDKILSDTSNLANYFAYHTGPLSIPGGCETLAFYDLKDPNNPNGYPDMELLFEAGSLASEQTLKENFGIDNELYDAVYRPILGAESWMILPMLMRPKSKGRVMLKDRNPFHKPLIYPNYYAHEEDVETMVGGIKKSIELGKTKAFQRMGSKLHDIPLPGCKMHKFSSDDYWRCVVRQLTLTIYHICGTCKMGPNGDPTAVVDPRLRVHGINRLRVIDVSIIPQIPVGHTNGPTYMIAEKGADLIKEDWGVKVK
ncbi:glucose dehydrogenase [FAD, quinone]-like [Periplaneta americana]|uniref:glucose dehydrogenase [FAD, quinone]-like n=1 Tax=Periplaneta americana TaxID=6978 RepID=UPI0037E96B3F